MKHLTAYKLFENNNDILNSVKDCFVEFIDEESIDIYYDYDNVLKLDLTIKSPVEGSIDLDSLSNVYKKNHEMIEDVKVALLRLKEQYPDIDEEIIFEGAWVEFENAMVGTLTITFYQEKPQTGLFYKKRGDNFIKVDDDKVRDILKLDKDVKLSIWSSGSSDTLKIDFPNETSFMKHMYRDYLTRRDELPSSFNNEGVEDALIINPELMERYQKLGNNFDKLKIEGEPFVTKIERVDGSGNQQRYYQNGVEMSKQAWYVSLKLNKKFEFSL